MNDFVWRSIQLNLTLKIGTSDIFWRYVIESDEKYNDKTLLLLLFLSGNQFIKKLNEH